MHRLPLDMQSRVIHVALVGCGGNGSQMLHKLARLDFALRELGRPGLAVTVYDPDTVSTANIGRQLFSPDDVGLNKAIVLVHRINMSYGFSWTARPTAYSPMQPYPNDYRCDVLISCVDSAQARRELWLAIKDLSSSVKPKYWLDLGNTRDSGQVILGEMPLTDEGIAASVPARIALDGARLDPEKHLREARAKLEARRLPTVVEIFPALLDRRRKEDNAPSCSLAEALEKQSLFVNDQMSTWGAQLLDGLLREGKLDYHGVFINLQTGAARPLPCREREVVTKAAGSTPAVRRAA
jgi:PRTRC genetic system ThiF family protein